MAMVSSFKHRYVLSEIYDYSAIHLPLKTTSRIKYTCFDVSQSFLVLGASSGGLYIFRREPCTFLQLLPNKEGPVSQISISPDERLIAFATQKSVVCVVERTEGGGARLLNRSNEHTGSQITALQWAHTSDQIFIGDNTGRLSVINVSLFMSKNIFQIPAFIFMQLDSGVVQISCHDDMLLVSTMTHSYVCDTTKEQYRQIGTKLRDGEYGACFHGEKIYCARPGSRLWEVDLEGTVQSTHQFKQALASKPVLVVSETLNLMRSKTKENWPQQSFNFAKLSIIMKYLFTFKRDGIYIFDPESVDVVLWSDHYKDILDAKCFDDTVYIWTQSRKIQALTLVTLEKCLLRLYFREKYRLCHDLCSYFSVELLESPVTLMKLYPLSSLTNFVADCDETVLNVLKEINAAALEKEKATRLESGIFLVDNHHICRKLLRENHPLNNNNKNGTKVNTKINRVRNPRSHSLPPDVKLRQKMKSGGSCSVPSGSSPSLPELIRSSGDDFDGSMDGIFVNAHKKDRHDNGLFLVPQLPFLPLSSPDIIHDALMEIGHNMSGKFVTGTKTLKDKWQVLEGKLKFSKVDNTFEKLDFRSNVNGEDVRNNLVNSKDADDRRGVTGDEENEEEEEEEIVIGRKTTCNNNNPNFTATEILNLCYELEKLENGLRSDYMEKLLAAVLNTYKKYVDFVRADCRKNISDVKYFPFNQYLPEKYVAIIQKLFHEILNSGELLICLSKQQNPASVLEHSGLEIHPEIFKNVYPTHVLQSDVLLSRILVIFSEILDPYTILQNLDTVDLACTYLSWCSVMERFQEGALQYFTKDGGESVNVGCKEWPLPLLLNAMFLLLRLDQVEPALEMSKQGNVTLHTVSYIILKLAAHLQQSGIPKEEAEKKCSFLFLSYISKLEDLNVDIEDRGLLFHMERAFVIVNTDLEYSVCRCGFPKPKQGKRNIKFPDIGKTLLSRFWDIRVEPSCIKPDLLSHTDDIKELCKLSGDQGDENFWSLIGSLDEEGGHILQPGISESLEHLKTICSVVPPLLLWFLSNKLKNRKPAALFNIKTVLVLQLGMLAELEHDDDCNKWAQIIQLNCKIGRGECCFCSRKFEPVQLANWNHLATAALKSVGPAVTLMILHQNVNELPHGMLNKQFYQACILSGLVDARVKGCRERVVENVNASCVNSTAPLSNTMGADVISALSMDLGPKVSVDRLSSKDNYHWGVTVDIEQGCCSLCSLSVGAPRLLEDGGLRVFQCGHAFHLVCLKVARQVQSCPVCLR